MINSDTINLSTAHSDTTDVSDGSRLFIQLQCVHCLYSSHWLQSFRHFTVHTFQAYLFSTALSHKAHYSNEHIMGSSAPSQLAGRVKSSHRGLLTTPWAGWLVNVKQQIVLCHSRVDSKFGNSDTYPGMTGLLCRVSCHNCSTIWLFGCQCRQLAL